MNYGTIGVHVFGGARRGFDVPTVKLPALFRRSLWALNIGNILLTQLQHPPLESANTWGTNTSLPVAACLTLAFDSFLKYNAVFLSLSPTKLVSLCGFCDNPFPLSQWHLLLCKDR